ncbi:MAG: hypothetical protein FJ290_06410 [Planctomycetes bacterium]|nr:hypothetical protein [Planctomycetota bacterium]
MFVPESYVPGPFPPRETLEHMAKASEEAEIYLRQHADVGKKLSSLWFTCYHVLFRATPSDLDTLARFGVVPFSEGINEMVYGVNFALMGIYKTALERLRSFLELYIVGVYFADPSVPKQDAREWFAGHTGTPFMTKMRKALFVREHFLTADREFSFSEDLATTYNYLCDYVHTRGFWKTHSRLGANIPCFSPTSLTDFVEAFGRSAECVAIALALQFPIILQPVPVSDKFGLDGPTSGFLEEGEVRLLEGLIAQDKLRVLREISANDPEVQGTVEAIYALPDATPEQVEQQMIEMDKVEIEGSGLQHWLENQRAVMKLVPESEKEKFLARIEALSAWAKERGFDVPPRWQQPTGG